MPPKRLLPIYQAKWCQTYIAPIFLFNSEKVPLCYNHPVFMFVSHFGFRINSPILSALGLIIIPLEAILTQ